MRPARGASGGVRLGILGFGRLPQRYYAPALRALPRVAALVIADPLPASRTAATRMLPGATVVGDVAALLATAPDAVVVATPPSTHLTLWNALAARGIPVLIEKPFVLRGELAQVARGPDVEPLLMIDFNRRFWPPYVRLGELVRAGAVGAARTIELAVHVDVAPWCTVTAHRLAAGEGGVLYDLGSQALDLVCTIAGAEPTTLVARAASRRWTCDHVRLEAALTSGARAVCDLAYDVETFERVTVVGDGGTVACADPNMRVHLVRGDAAVARARRRAADVTTLAYYALRRSRSMARATIATALARFVDGVISGAPFAPGFADAARNSAWLERAQVEIGT